MTAVAWLSPDASIALFTPRRSPGSVEWVEQRRLADDPLALDLPLHGAGGRGFSEQGKPVAEHARTERGVQ
jgi:hypothetical protein